VEIFQVTGLALVAGIMVVIVRQQRPELALQLAVAAGAVIFFSIVGRIVQVVDVLHMLSTRARIDSLYMGTVLKIVGIAYVADFGSQILQDAGEKAIAAKVELAGKVLIMLMAVPIIVAIMENILRLM
jgi:stage III sporulation protein AD